MSVLKTTQTIKVKVSANGGLQPLATNTPVILKNTVREDIKLSELADVVANTAANGAYLVFNAATGKYEVKIVETTLDSISNFDSAPAGAPASNGDIVVFNTTTNKYEVRPLTIALGDLTDVNVGSPANGYVLVYNALTSKYDVKQLSTTIASLLDVEGTPVDGATLVYNASTNKYEIKVLDSVPAVDGSSTPITIKVSSEVQPSNVVPGELVYSNTINALYIGNDVLSTLIAGEKFVYIQRAIPGQLTSNSALIVDGNSFIDAIKTTSLEIGVSGTSNLVAITSISNFANSTQLGEFAYGSNNELVTSAAIKNYIDEVVSQGGGAGGNASPYVLPIANSSVLGGVKIGGGLSIDSITGVLSATGGAGGYILPTASAGTIGGIRIGSGLVIDPDGVVSVAGPGGNVGVTVEGAQDAAANLFLHNQHTGISFVYDDVNNRIIATSTGTPGATNLNGLTDVTLSLVANNNTLIYDSSSSQWKNYAIQGTPNEVDISFAPGTVTLGLPNNVTITSNLSIGNTLNVTGSANVNGNATFNSNVTIGQTLRVSNTSVFSNVVVVNSSLEVSNYANFANTVSVARSLSVTRQSTFGNTVSVAGQLNVNNNATIAGNAAIGNVLFAANVIANNISLANGLLNVVGNTVLTGITTINGNTVIGNTATDIVTINAELASNIIPAANNIYSLGTAERRFKDIYVSGGTIFVDEVQLSSPPGGGLAVEGPLAVNGHATIVGNVSSQSILVDGQANVTGNLFIGTNSNNVVVFNSSIDSSLVPLTHNTHNIGTANKQFANLYAVNVNAHDGAFTGNLHVTGNFTVLGNVTSISVTTVEIEDSLLKVAANNTADTIDQGFYGKAVQGTTTVYSGIARDASDGKFKVFTTSAEPTATVDTNDPSFKISTLVSYLESGGFISNSSNITLNSNGSITVTIVANTLSLSTPLGVSSGGTGRNTFTNNAILYGNGTNVIQQVSGLDGQILQIANGVPTFGYIDSGYY